MSSTRQPFDTLSSSQGNILTRKQSSQVNQKSNTHSGSATGIENINAIPPTSALSTSISKFIPSSALDSTLDPSIPTQPENKNSNNLAIVQQQHVRVLRGNVDADTSTINIYHDDEDEDQVNDLLDSNKRRSKEEEEDRNNNKSSRVEADDDFMSGGLAAEASGTVPDTCNRIGRATALSGRARLSDLRSAMPLSSLLAPNIAQVLSSRSTTMEYISESRKRLIQYMSLNKQYAQARTVETMKNNQLVKANKVLSERVAQLKHTNQRIYNELKHAREQLKHQQIHRSTVTPTSLSSISHPEPAAAAADEANGTATATTSNGNQVELSHVKARLEDARNECDQLKVRIDEQDREKQELTSQHIDAMSKALQYSNELRMEKKRLEDMINSINEMIASHEASVGRDADDVSEQSLLHRITMLFADVHNLIALNNSLREEINGYVELSEGEGDMKEQYNMLQEELMDEKAKNEALLISNLQIATTCGDLEEEINKSHQHIAVLHDELTSVCEKIAAIAVSNQAIANEESAGMEARKELLSELHSMMHQSIVFHTDDDTDILADTGVHSHHTPSARDVDLPVRTPLGRESHDYGASDNVATNVESFIERIKQPVTQSSLVLDRILSPGGATTSSPYKLQQPDSPDKQQR